MDWEKMMHIKLGSDQYGVCNNYQLANGREISYLDVEKTNAVCVLGSGAKEALFDYTDPVGETITLNGQPFLWLATTSPWTSSIGRRWTMSLSSPTPSTGP